MTVIIVIITLVNRSCSDVGQVWAMLRNMKNCSCQNSKLGHCGNDDNKYFTTVVYDKTFYCIVHLMPAMIILQLKQVILILTLYAILSKVINTLHIELGAKLGFIGLRFLSAFRGPQKN